ncbi:facilitated trehalose transporter Tret1-like [Ostrinia furnacalis]|uniref:facilitated trehalose transporter Tret1-like n=1 Tax=Ostrinia furnacalis TaxID=93504 RepID=UPI00103A058A|nr:facilitated trehalose transporter Tret1-like [Ostrinia furnacalis]
MMTGKSIQWITPFTRQCYVTMGVSLSMMQMGLIMGFSTILLPQLKSPGSSIPIDDDYGSWIASLPAVTILIGNFTIPSIMGQFGRKIASLTCIFITIAGWISVYLANDVISILAARGLQGIALGMVSALGPVLIGEYTSPKNRGAFLMTISITIGIGVLAVHVLGSYLRWQTAALIVIAMTVVDLLIVISSPESPAWLADQGRFEECTVVFRWLRGDTEEDELEKMIKTSTALRKEKEGVATEDSSLVKMWNNIKDFRLTLKRNEFYKPIVIMLHIYTMAQWCGLHVLASYGFVLIHSTIGTNINVPLMIISLDCNRIISNTIALILIRKIRRKFMMFSTIGLNIVCLLAVAGYTYSKTYNLITLDNEYVGIALLHIMTLSMGMGCLPISFILAGEILPLQFKSLAGGISSSFFSLNMFIALKTLPLLMNSIDIHGTFTAYAVLLIYCLTVAGCMLPETKDKTLQEIEEEFKGKKKPVPAGLTP